MWVCQISMIAALMKASICFIFTERVVILLLSWVQTDLFPYCWSNFALKLQNAFSFMISDQLVASIKCSEVGWASISYACVQIFQGIIKWSKFSLWVIPWNSFSAVAREHSADSYPQKPPTLSSKRQKENRGHKCKFSAVLITLSICFARQRHWPCCFCFFSEMILLMSPTRVLEKKRFCT